MKVLVTGGAGYIGSTLVKELLKQGYFVRVVDCLKWGGEALSGFFANPQFEFIKGDLRKEDVRKRALIGADAVIHLAAIVGDPACKKEPELAEEVNWRASKSIFDLAGRVGVKRFIFASTCSNYGRMPDADRYLDEESVLNPISLYAKLKVKFEKYILEEKLNPLVVTSLRFATAYGVSMRMRFDLTVNEFVKEVFFDRELVVYGEKFWRPYCHVEDLAKACVCVLGTDKKLVQREVFNVGDTRENYQKQMIVDLIKRRFPRMKVRFVPKDEDPRDYRVDFGKIKNKLKFQIARRLEDGIDEVMQLLGRGELKNPDNSSYRNI